MKRIPEPELMETPEQAAAYAAADFAAPHERVVALFRRLFPDARPRKALDLGCGPGDIACRFARTFRSCRVLGVDGAPAMLACGQRALRREPALARRVTLVRGLLQDWRPTRRFPVILCNSLLHHLYDPQVLWSCIRRCAAPGARVFVVDLRRPPTRRAARALRDRYAAGEPAILRRDFLHSLHAAFTPAEIRAQLREAGLDGLRVRALGDRHVMAWGRIGERNLKRET
jgi:ubiquinone/menaquinone biosynthesis C-methylase UbiE